MREALYELNTDGRGIVRISVCMYVSSERPHEAVTYNDLRLQKIWHRHKLKPLK